MASSLIMINANLNLTLIGRAWGFYLYNGKSMFATWFSVSFMFNSKEQNGIVFGNG